MKTRLILLLVGFASFARASEPSLAFPSGKIALPSLALSGLGKEAPPSFLRESVPPDQVKTPTFGLEKKSTPGVIVPRADLDPRMIISPPSSVDFKLRVIPSKPKG